MAHVNSQPTNADPNLLDYATLTRSFTWDQVYQDLNPLQESRGLNIAHIAVDRHAKGPLKNHTAIRFIRRSRTIKELTYNDLYEQSNQFANVLLMLGITKEDSVFTLMGRIPEFYIAAIGTLKNRAVFCPLFSFLGVEQAFQRLKRGDAKILVTTVEIYSKKVKPMVDRLPSLKHILLTNSETHVDNKVLSLPFLMENTSTTFRIPLTLQEDPAFLHFTSGTTGMPKGALHVHRSLLTHELTRKLVLDLHPDDVYWCTADPGWVTGTSYGMIIPLVNGVTNIVDEYVCDASRWYSILEEHKVNVWFAEPTAIRRLMRMRIKPGKKYNLEHLRLILSVGDPLNDEAA